MLTKLKNNDTKQYISLASNGLTYLRYKELTGQCLGVALSELFTTLKDSISFISKIEELQKNIDNYDTLSKPKQKEIDNKLSKITASTSTLASVMDKLILIVASMISTAESPVIRHVEDIIADIDLNWFAGDTKELQSIMDLIKSLLPQKVVQKKTNKVMK